MSDSLALVGDWNATPHDHGRWSPSWVATSSELHIESAGPGRHGDIDFPMADCPIHQLARHAPPGGVSRSDHDLITFVLYPPHKNTTAGPGAGMAVSVPHEQEHAIRVGTWNLLYGRDPKVVAAQVRQVLASRDLDVLMLQEAADYHHALSNLAGWRLLAYEGRGKAHNVMLVRDELPITRPRLVKLSPVGWWLVTGGRHAPLYATSCVVLWCRLVDVHLPPSVNWTPRGRITGPVQRVAAYAAAAGKLVRWAKANKHHRS